MYNVLLKYLIFFRTFTVLVVAFHIQSACFLIHYPADLLECYQTKKVFPYFTTITKINTNLLAVVARDLIYAAGWLSMSLSVVSKSRRRPLVVPSGVWKRAWVAVFQFPRRDFKK